MEAKFYPQKKGEKKGLDVKKGVGCTKKGIGCKKAGVDDMIG